MKKTILVALVAFFSFTFSPTNSVPIQLKKRTLLSNSNLSSQKFASNKTNLNVEKKIIDNKDGYVYLSSIDVSAVSYTSRSRLCLLHVRVSWTPGCVANKTESNYYASNCFLSTGTLELEPNEIVDAYNAHSGDVCVKAFWPQSSSFSTSFTSSWGGTFSSDFNLSSALEASLGTDTSIKKTEGASIGAGLTLNWSTSMQTTSSDPILSAQRSSSAKNKVTWLYRITNCKIAGSATYNLDAYILFELRDNAMRYSNGTFELDREVSYQCEYYTTFLWHEDWRSGTNYTSDGSNTLEAKEK